MPIDYDNLRCAKCGAKSPRPTYRLTFKGAANRRCVKCRNEAKGNNGRWLSTRNAGIPVGPIAEQVILGSVLGDGSLEKPPPGSKNYGFAIKHGLKQTAYLLHKAKLLGPLVRKVDHPKERIRLRCVAHPHFTSLARLLIERKTNMKSLAEALAPVGPLALAVWYMDDGCYTPARIRQDGWNDSAAIRFCTNAFSSAKICFLKSLLVRVAGVKRPGNCQWRNPRKPGEPYHGIRLSMDDVPTFLDVVRPHMCGFGMEYKLGEK